MDRKWYCAIRNSGIDKPIYIIPEAIDANIGTVLPYKTPKIEEYRFYSIFEWTERKNPVALLEAYWQEFTEKDAVALVLKTYVDNFTPDKRRTIDEYIAAIKKRLQLPYYAPVYLYRHLIARNQIYAFHKTFDCFVSPHRGEGWGIPQMEAMLTGNPIISTDCGGIHEYLKDKETAYLLPCTMVLVGNTAINSGTATIKWAQVTVGDIRHHAVCMVTGMRRGELANSVKSS